MTEFTPKQGRYLSFIHAYIDGFGYPPAESEIARAMKVSPPSVNQMMKTLEKKGFIRRKPGVARSIEILVSPDLIPKWPERIVAVRRAWLPVEPTQRSGRQVASRAAVYRFKITLKETQPAIWRRIETKDVTLEKLHGLIQASMGWTNSHLHCFKIGNKRYTDPRFIEGFFDDLGETSYAGVRVSDLVSEYGTRLQLIYEYDYGDGWRHAIELEEVTAPEPRVRYPRCIDGARACPPEDIGGVWGFVEFVEAITNPDHSQHEEFLKWYGPFDPEYFDPAKATRRMQQGLPVWSRMARKKTRKVGTRKPRKVSNTDRFALIEKALQKRTKADIICLALKLAKKDASMARDLERELAIEKPVDLLVADVSSAIDRATDFDAGGMNYDSDVDWQAYEDVKLGLQKLIELGRLEDAKTLALKLMKDGSYQVERSDEGLMTDDIQDCLKPVIRAVKAAQDKEASKWASEMLRADRVGFICDRELKQLAKS